MKIYKQVKTCFLIKNKSKGNMIIFFGKFHSLIIQHLHSKAEIVSS